ncbi:MAG TPA: signal peptidase I [Anaerolineae bacterium]|nr:signal peptidase I [Anaerolineae bacterium]
MSDNSARHSAEAYQSAARETLRTVELSEVLRLTVTSDSMRPLLQVGDVVVVQPIEPRTLRPGDVIVVQRDGAWITHRLVTVDARGWYTHGDNARTSDAAASADEIIGRVIAIERGDQTIDLQQPHWRAIDRRINRIQRWQMHLFATLRQWGGGRSNRVTHVLAVLINWPFHLAVRLLLRF